MQPNNGAWLYHGILYRLVAERHLSLAAACGIVRVLHLSKTMSLAKSDLHAAAWVCNALRFLTRNRPAGALRCEVIRSMYASCRVNLLDLMPQVRRSGMPQSDLYPVGKRGQATGLSAAGHSVSVSLGRPAC